MVCCVIVYLLYVVVLLILVGPEDGFFTLARHLRPAEPRPCPVYMYTYILYV